MYDDNTGKQLKDFPVLETGEVYIYIIKNTENRIKIGLTTNIQQRYQSLCGSNSQGIAITDVFVSEPTYLKSMETTMHNHFHRYRISGTEWFQNGEELYSEACEYLQSLFSSTSYARCNELRKKVTYDKSNKS